MDRIVKQSPIAIANALNQEVADRLREIAYLLQKQNANPFRVRAYFNAANTVEKLPKNIKDIVERENIQGLIDLPTIGLGIAQSIYEYVAIGRMTRLNNLKGESDPVRLFQSIPGVGLALASRIYSYTHADSFEALEQALHNGSLSRVPGMGESRLNGIQAWLLTTLGRQLKRSDVKQSVENFPSISLLLNVDAKYREKANAGKLQTITPSRFNPKRVAWLPIYHTKHDRWHFTVLFSNTLLANELKRTNDWVIIYFYDEQHQEGQYTVVTETRGPLIGQRVIRGREQECREFYGF